MIFLRFFSNFRCFFVHLSLTPPGIKAISVKKILTKRLGYLENFLLDQENYFDDRQVVNHKISYTKSKFGKG